MVYKDPEVRRNKSREAMRKLRARDPERAKAQARKYAQRARQRKKEKET
jgi:hypothetical protein